ncbi:MAG TPA: hypothetical protein V6C63_11045 [Allocoleopsis sp.]
MVNQTHPQRIQQQLLDTAMQLLQKRPFILWGASLVLVLLMGGIALKGLIYPGPLEPTEPELVTAPAKPQPTQIPEFDSNLWLFGAVALGCAAGSVLISRQLERLGSRSQSSPAKPKPRAVTSRLTATPQRQPGKATRQSSPSVRRKKAAAAVKRGSAPAGTVFQAETTRMRPATYPATSVVIEPVVTVVPEDESHPLDWGEASLAEMMDIRKQKPLSSLL